MINYWAFVDPNAQEHDLNRWMVWVKCNGKKCGYQDTIPLQWMPSGYEFGTKIKTNVKCYECSRAYFHSDPRPICPIRKLPTSWENIARRSIRLLKKEGSL